jgi:hypothetical protein
MLAKVFDIHVITSGSLLLRLSHHRKGLSTQPVVAWHSAFEVPFVPAEEGDVRRELAAVLAGEDTACRDPGLLELEGVGAVGGEQDVVLPDRVEVVDPVVASDRRGRPDARRHRGAGGTAEQLDPVLRVEDAGDIVRRGGDVGVQVDLILASSSAGSAAPR